MTLDNFRGWFEGRDEGFWEGWAVGWHDGWRDGTDEGCLVGLRDGWKDGWRVGVLEGCWLGWEDGWDDGWVVRIFWGIFVGNVPLANWNSLIFLAISKLLWSYAQIIFQYNCLLNYKTIYKKAFGPMIADTNFHWNLYDHYLFKILISDHSRSRYFKISKYFYIYFIFN